MRRLIRSFMLPVIALVGFGCDESFSPKVEYEQRYVLQCFVQVQVPNLAPITVTAVLAHTYDVNGVDPTSNTTDPAIAGAEVSLTVNQKSYYLLGAQRPSRDTSRYPGKQWYYTTSVPYIMPDNVVTVTAKLPNGKTLNAQTTLPSSRPFSSNYDFASGLTRPFNLQPGKPNWSISWDNNMDIEVHLFVPRLTIAYAKLVGSGEVWSSVTVPSKYVSSQGRVIPVYPSVSSEKQCSFEFAALDSAMASISAGDSVKSRYGTHSARLEVIEYDLPLSKYYSSINGSLDQFSIRTEQSVYSNVGGGIGILGSSVIHWVDYTFDERYLQRFGYRIR
jgi:hypothetical protein